SVIENCVDHLSPLPVIGRDGNTYHPPARYKGRFLGYIDVSTIILLAINHLHDLVEEAASRLR
ncbi:MAG TPA: hypothetical protein VGD23_13545, partial [Sphingomicrobium sp.]